MARTAVEIPHLISSMYEGLVHTSGSLHRSDRFFSLPLPHATHWAVLSSRMQLRSSERMRLRTSCLGYSIRLLQVPSWPQQSWSLLVVHRIGSSFSLYCCFIALNPLRPLLQWGWHSRVKA